MTAEEARARVALVRQALSRGLRALSAPRPRWRAAWAWLSLAAALAAALAEDCDGEEGSTMARGAGEMMGADGTPATVGEIEGDVDGDR